jgi:hypothetical protein
VSKLSERDKWRIAMMADSSLEPAHRCVLVALSEFMNFDPRQGPVLGNAHPGDPLLVERTGFSESTVYRARKAGERAGWIELVREGGFRRSGSNASTYRGTFPARNGEERSAQRARVEAMHADRKAQYARVMERSRNRVEPMDEDLTYESWEAQREAEVG